MLRWRQDWGSEVGKGWRSDVGRQMSECEGNMREEERGQKTGVGGLRSEGRKGTGRDRNLRSEVGSRRSEI